MNKQTYTRAGLWMIGSSFMMMLSLFSSSLAAFPNLPIVKSPPATSRNLNLERMSIGRVKLNMEERAVIRLFGTPRNRSQRFGACTGSNEADLSYKMLSINTTETTANNGRFEVNAITTTNPQYSTPEGIHVGDLITKALKFYPVTKTVNEDKSGTSWSYFEDRTMISLTFKVGKNGRISSISLSQLMC